MAPSSRIIGLADRIDRVNAAVGRATAWAALFVVLVQFVVVLLRYVFGIGSIWLTESILYGNATMFMLAAAWTLREGGHVRVDVFYAEATPRRKALIDLAGALLLLLPFMIVLAWFALPYVARSWAILEGSRETSGLPMVFLLKTLIPLFAVLMALQGISQAIRAWSDLNTTRVTPGFDPGVHRSSQDGLPGHRRAKRRRPSDGYARQ
jgi:TRAP-type mannitol/chloroaromatic compound transport system permease small subunit